MLAINTNTSSLFAQNSLTGAQNALATSVQRLSSGLRINNAADDAAGLAISQNLQSQINGVNQSIQCLSDATSLLQVADSSLSSIQDILLKMKGLATQGLDGSLNANQRLDIANQLDDLNSEINATAQRAKFNGIGIIASGSSVDTANSSIKIGAALSTEAISISDNGLGHYAVGGSAGANANLGDAAITKSGINSTFQIALDPSLSAYTPGTYVLSSSGNNLTLSGKFKGQYQTQTVVVADAESGLDSSANRTTSQTLNFSNFGIQINLSTTVSQGAVETGAQLATAIVGKGNYASSNQSSIQINGNGGAISDIRISGAVNGNYQLTKVGTGQIKLTNTGAGGYTVSETISLKNNAQNAIQTLNFESMGIAIDVQSYQAQTASQIADELVAVSGGSSSTTIISSGYTSATNAINLDATTGYVLTIDGNTYSTKGTLNGVANSKVGTLGSATTIDALATWINNLKQNLKTL
jgi:flagellin